MKRILFNFLFILRIYIILAINHNQKYIYTSDYFLLNRLNYVQLPEHALFSNIGTNQDYLVLFPEQKVNILLDFGVLDIHVGPPDIRFMR